MGSRIAAGAVCVRLAVHARVRRCRPRRGHLSGRVNRRALGHFREELGRARRESLSHHARVGRRPRGALLAPRRLVGLRALALRAHPPARDLVGRDRRERGLVQLVEHLNEPAALPVEEALDGREVGARLLLAGDCLQSRCRLGAWRHQRRLHVLGRLGRGGLELFLALLELLAARRLVGREPRRRRRPRRQSLCHRRLQLAGTDRDAAVRALRLDERFDDGGRRRRARRRARFLGLSLALHDLDALRQAREEDCLGVGRGRLRVAPARLVRLAKLLQRLVDQHDASLSGESRSRLHEWQNAGGELHRRRAARHVAKHLRQERAELTRGALRVDERESPRRGAPPPRDRRLQQGHATPCAR
eukprot:3759462-Prymnesium_polylepis.2